MALVGGPAVVERRMRSLGLANINVNRYLGDLTFEMDGVANPPPREEWTLALQRRLVWAVGAAELREARARYTRDPRDTATPNDMALLLARLQLGKVLPRVQTNLLLDVMTRAKTSGQRLKGLLPPDTPVAHKTGTTGVVINDVGIITLPDSTHLVIAAFVMNGARAATMQRTIAQLSGAAFESFTGKPLPPPKKSPVRAKKNIHRKAKATPRRRR
jgi:beta-lactamase class A